MRIQTRHMHGRIVQRILDFVLTHPCGPLRIPDLAHTAGLSRWHIARVFRAQTGESPSEFLRRIRLERAAHRLLNTKIAIGAIGFEAGYQDSPSFTRAFLKAFGTLPSTMRAKKEIDWQLPSDCGFHWRATSAVSAYSPVELTNRGPEVEIIGVDGFTVGRKRIMGSYSNVRQRWIDLYDTILRDRNMPAGTRYLAIYHDSIDRTPIEQLRLDLCVVRPDGLVEPGLECGKMPAGTYVRSKDFFCGEAGNDTWCRMSRHWIPSIGARPHNVPAYEESLICPALHADPPIRIYIGLEIDLEPGR
ncbi:MAG: AraC family transcriptional regulator [Fimbriimonadaceae bacterium]|nr:AraC family transcriptional regulator [Fimbriimonadaceae bacterium]